MAEETRQKLSLLSLTEAPKRPYNVLIPKDGSIYDYRFIKEVRCFCFLLEYVFVN